MPNEDGTPTYEELQEQARVAQEELEKVNNDIAFLKTDEGKKWYKENMLSEKEETPVKPKENKEEKKEEKEVINADEITKNAVAMALKAQEKKQVISQIVSGSNTTIDDLAKYLHETSYPGVPIVQIVQQIQEDPGIAQFAVNTYTVAQEKQRLASTEYFVDTTPVTSVAKDKLHPIEREMAIMGGLKEEDVLAATPDMEITY